jgi:hypothetical protein
VYAGASNSSSITSLSIVEKIWGIAELCGARFQLLFFKRSGFDLNYSWIHYDIVVDRVVLMNLSFESCDLVLFWARYAWLKVWCSILFSSIWVCCDELCWNAYGSWMYMTWWIVWCYFF